MVTTRFIGRLGNSMFQIAAVVAYAKKYGYQWAVPHNARESSIHRVFPDMPKTYGEGSNHPRNGYDAEWYAHYDIPNAGGSVLLAGYFQSEKFFINAKDEVKDLFKLKYNPEYEGFTSIHVRRGDFLVNPTHFPPMPMAYFEQAIHQFDYDAKFLIFSDDIAWCRAAFDNYFNGFLNDRLSFSEGKSELEDLSMMASCSHHIICNSTFSWWAAYLGHNPDRKIITPHHTDWYGPDNGVVVEARRKGILPCLDLIPEGWIQIKI